MSLSPFHSFQSRFVTYLLNFPHTTVLKYQKSVCCNYNGNWTRRNQTLHQNLEIRHCGEQGM